MADVILNAKHYNTRPSILLGIDNDYEAYCFDEVARVLYVHSLDSEGVPNLYKFYKPEEQNNEFIEFITQQGGDK